MFICDLSWGFFDGASHNGIGGAGGILHIYEDWWYKFVAGIGRAGNNMAEKRENRDFDIYGLFKLLRLPTRKHK